MIKLRNILFETALRTRQGSVIRRYHNNVGKQVGSSLYVHKLYADEIIPRNILNKANEILTRSNPDFNYNALMWDVKRNIVRFDESPDFDTAQEPHVGEYIAITLNRSQPPRKGHSDSIWHHKWLWVKDDYTGFNVDKSKEWSRMWLSKLREPAKGTDLTWRSQLKRYGLTEAFNIGHTQAILTNDPPTLYGSERYEGTHWEIVQRLFPEEWETYTNELLDTVDDAHKDDEDIRTDITFEVANKIALLHKLVRIVIEGDELIFNTGHNAVPSHGQMMLLRKYAKDHGMELVQSVNLKKMYIDLTENKQLLMEARATPKQLVEFLRGQIKGTEWEGKVFAVGGFVRDELLGKEPKDLDIVVGKFQGGVEFTTWLGKKLNIYKEGSNPVIYPTFGTANLRLDGVIWNGVDFTGESIDAVMFRKEQYHDPNSRKPTVQYTPYIEVDASRRDITFNSLYKDIATGKVLDPTGQGINDLKSGIVRTAIDPTLIYTDDALRMFRAVRFATQFDFQLSPEIIDGIKKNLHRLGNTSKERVRDELNKILLSNNPRRGIELLRDVRLLPYVGKELQQMIGLMQTVHHKHDAFEHTMEVLKETNPELITRLIALFHDIGKTATRTETPTGVHFYEHEDVGAEIAERIMRELKYPLDLINAVKIGVKHHMKLKHGGDDAVKLSDKSLRKFINAVGANLEHVLNVIHADNIAHADASTMPNQINAVRQRLKTLDMKTPEVTLPINGDDIMGMGVPQGRKVGEILSAITDVWFENPKITREEALAIVKRMI